MTQEAFNCLSASVILLIDECFDIVSADEYQIEKLGRSVFDLLLHILSTPQSSVTLLRTLGGKFLELLLKLSCLLVLMAALNAVIFIISLFFSRLMFDQVLHML